MIRIQPRTPLALASHVNRPHGRRTLAGWGLRVGIFCAVFPSFASAQASSDVPLRQVRVSGACTRQVSPDRGAIIVTAEFRDPDLKVAANHATQSYERARDAVKKLGLKDLELRTVEYSMGEVREWENNKNVLKGYRARMGLRVASSQIERLGEVIALATREGMKDVGNLQSYLSDAQDLKERVACLQEAAENARVKAEKLATALGARVGEALVIHESGGVSTSPEPRPVMMMAEKSLSRGAAEPASIEAGQQTLSLSVDVTFALK